MKAGAKEYLLHRFDRHELRGKAAGEPARPTHVRFRPENFPNGAGVPPNLNPSIGELLNALIGLRISSYGMLKRSQISRTHIYENRTRRWNLLQLVSPHLSRAVDGSRPPS